MSKVTSGLEVVADLPALAQAALARLTACALESVRLRGRFTIALSGGSTPRALYQLLAQHPELPWQHMELCFGDERAVPPQHPESNARMVHEALTHCSFVPAERVHRIRAELPAREAAADYQHTLQTLFGHETDLPRFDLVLLGLGPDGHTASLFPYTQALSESRLWVTAHQVEARPRPRERRVMTQHSERITLTFPVLNNARELLFLVSGVEKAQAVRAVLEGNAEISAIPARGIRPSTGQLHFLADRPAASLLTR